MSSSPDYFFFKLQDAHPGVLGETFLIVTVNLDFSGRYIGEYRLLTAAKGGDVTTGQVVFDQSLIAGLAIANPVEFCRDETLKFAYSEVADRLLAAEGTYGAASVFGRPCSFVHATKDELMSLYLRGELRGKWGSVTKDCMSDELTALIRVWRRVTPLAVYKYD